MNNSRRLFAVLLFAILLSPALIAQNTPSHRRDSILKEPKMQAVLKDDFRKQTIAWFYLLNKVHTVVTYDSQSRDTTWVNEWGHREKEVRYWKDRKSSVYTYTYDEFGEMTMMYGEFYDDSNRISTIYIHNYSYEIVKNGLSERCVKVEDVTIEFRKGVPADTFYGVDLYEFNGAGQEIKRITTDVDRWCGAGEAEPFTAIATYTYDKKGNLMQEKELRKGGCQGKKELTETYEYYADGLLKEIVRKEDGITVDSTYYERDGSGNTIRYYGYWAPSKHTYESHCSYMARGLKSKCENNYGDKRDTEYYEYTYYP